MYSSNVSKSFCHFFDCSLRMNEILLKIENNTEAHGTAVIITKIILDLLDMRNIEKHLIIGLVFDKTSVNTGIHKGVTACLEKAFSSFLQLAKANVINFDIFNTIAL